jgi:cytochrome c
MEVFMPRIPIVGLTCSMFLILLSSPAVPQEPAGGDAGSGQLIFNNTCRTCHTTKEGDNRMGPNLHNIIGRKAGSLPNFGYSSAMKGADFVWDTGKLDSFITKPDAVVPGNDMKPYGGLVSAEERTKLIAFLQSTTSDSKPGTSKHFLFQTACKSDSRLSMSEIKSEHIDGVTRRELESEECARWPNSPWDWRILVQGKVCSRAVVGDSDAARRRRRHGRDIPAGSSRSAVPYVRSAMASVARLA